MKKILLTVVLVVLTLPFDGYCLKEATHMAIDEKIATAGIGDFSFDDYLIDQLGFSNGAQEEIVGKNGEDINETRMIMKWLSYGGFMEDAPAYWYNFLPVVSDTRGKRHFHNPLEPNWEQMGSDLTN